MLRWEWEAEPQFPSGASVLIVSSSLWEEGEGIEALGPTETRGPIGIWLGELEEVNTGDVIGDREEVSFPCRAVLTDERLSQINPKWIGMEPTGHYRVYILTPGVEFLLTEVRQLLDQRLQIIERLEAALREVEYQDRPYGWPTLLAEK